MSFENRPKGAENPSEVISNHTRFLRIETVCERVQLSPPSVYRLQKSGKFPRSVKIGANSSRWLESEVESWMSARIADRKVRV